MSSAPQIPRASKIVGFDGEEMDIDHYLVQTYDEISEAADELPAIIEWLNEIKSSHIESRDNAETELKRLVGETYFALKGLGSVEFALQYSGSKMTEDAVGYAIDTTDAVVDQRKRIAAWNGHVSRIAGSIVSLQTKVELLRSSEATRRRVYDETSPSDSR